jgi:hypothetical protein
MRGYSKDNCYWATRLEQQNNTRFNHLVTWRDETLTIAQWARKTGLGYGLLLRRFADGWDSERALTLAHTGTGKKPSKDKR